ncbi:hypothetical protein ACLOJK_036402, partial [Asimina triloba]
CLLNCQTKESVLNSTPNPPKVKMSPKKSVVSKPKPSIKRPREPEVQELPWKMRDEAMRRRYS